LVITLLFLAHIQSGIILWSEYNIKKRAEVLGIITRHFFCFAVAGTGKQQPLVFWVIFYMKVGRCHFFYRRYSRKYNSNLVGDGTVTVVELMNLIVLFAFAPKYCLHYVNGCGPFRYLW
jgi:thiamine transporter ThiT